MSILAWFHSSLLFFAAFLTGGDTAEDCGNLQPTPWQSECQRHLGRLAFDAGPYRCHGGGGTLAVPCHLMNRRSPGGQVIFS